MSGPAGGVVGARAMARLAKIARIWTSRNDSMAAASTVIVLGLMGHSLVEYPLRTEALAVLFAFACSTMTVWRPEPRNARPDASDAADAATQPKAKAAKSKKALGKTPHRRSKRRRHRSARPGGAGSADW